MFSSRLRRMTLVSLFALVTLVAGTVALAVAATPRATPASFSAQYSAKYICGWLPPVPPDLDQYAKPGDYATSINIHNYTASGISGQFRPTIAYRNGSPTASLAPARSVSIAKGRSVVLDCVEIWASLSLPPGTFIQGNVHIGLPSVLPVHAVYTSQTHEDPNAGPGVAAGHSIDVEMVLPFNVPMAPANN